MRVGRYACVESRRDRVQLRDIRAHVAVAGGNQDGAHTRHHVSRDQDPALLVEQAYVAGRVPWGV